MSKHITDNGDGTKTITLKHPVEQGKIQIREVSLRTECTIGDLMSMDSGKGDIEKMLRLISELSQCSQNPAGVTFGTVQKMCASDYRNLAKVAGEALQDGDDEEDEDEGK